MRSRIRCVHRALLAITVLAGAAAGQNDVFEHLGLRVISSGPGTTVEIDRGDRDGVQVGDLVHLMPRGGGLLRGNVTEVAERSAMVELHAVQAPPPLGTRGEVLLPKSRFTEQPNRQPPRQSVQQPAPSQRQPTEPPAAHEHPPWQNPDQGWSPDKPLLAAVQGVRPEERAMLVTGRIYSIGALTTQADREETSNSFLRVGSDVDVRNPFRHGGGLHFGAELDYLTESDRQSGTDLLVHRLSYHYGGTRFEPIRWEVGRFPQWGVPELGVLDGGEWGMRRDGGDRFGASIGFMPEPDDDFQPFQDFQVAAYYQWASDDSEELTVTGAVQKTFHHTRADRDLLLLKTRYLPRDGWRLHGTAWIDYYTGSELAKASGLQLTQALASASREWGRSGVDISLRRLRYPDIRRNEFLRPLPDEVRDNRYDRLEASGWTPIASDQLLHADVGIWDDEDDDGAFAELGLEVSDWLLERSKTDFTLFGTLGQHTNASGVRLNWVKTVDNGHWDLLYEYSDHHLARVASNADDLLQQRFRAGRSFYGLAGWSFSVHVGADFWDQKNELELGFDMQKTF